MTNYPKVSVVTITYGHENYITQTLDGVLMQNYPGEIEYIIANDNSPDNTDEVVKSYFSSKNVPSNFSIKYKNHEVNKGVMPNFIWALKEVSSKYISMCEGDDYWTDPLKLQKQVDLLEKNVDCSMCVALHRQLSSSGLAEAKRNEGENRLKLNFPVAHERYFHTSTYLIRATALQTILKKYRDLLIGDTAMRYLLSAEGSFVLLNDYVSVYRITGTGVWTSLTEYDKAFAHYEIFSKFRKKHIKSRTAYYLEREISYLHSMLLLKKETDLYYKKEYYKLVLLRHKIRYQTKLANIRGKLKDLLKW